MQFDFAPLGRPGWWLALALLVINDHFLKRAGILPGWLTGKLSDFAFLVVAPVLVATLLPLALRGRRTIAVAAVTALFVSGKLSVAISDGLVALLAHLGVHGRLWQDPTDLVALAVLPVAIRLLGRTSPRSSWARLVRERVALVLGAAGCLATSGAHEIVSVRAPFLLNGTDLPATVRITWVVKQFPCSVPGLPPVQNGPAATAASLAASLTPGDLMAPEEVPIGSGQVLALVRPTATPTVGACSINLTTTTSCAAAILESPPAAPVLALATSGDSTTLAEVCPSQPGKPVDRTPNILTLATVNGTAAFVPAGNIQIAPVDLSAIAGRPSSPDSCQAIGDAYRVLLSAPQGCSSDVDCEGFAGLPAPGDAASCGVALSVPSAAGYADLLSRWRSGCQSVDDGRWCPAQQSAVCRDGACVLGCRDVALPACPVPCTDEIVPGNACPPDFRGAVCERRGLWCSCRNNGIDCVAPTPVSATCPYSCADGPGGVPADGGAGAADGG